MEIDELIEAYLASRKKQFARLGKEGVARVAYLAGYLAASQQSAQSDLGWTCEVCQSTNLESDLECGYCDTPRPSR